VDQIIYDYLEPADDPDVPQLMYVENAMELLEQAAKAYRHDPPKWSTAKGYIEDAARELKKIN